MVAPYKNCIDDCPICGGVGYIRYDVPVHHEDFGKMYPCPNKRFVSWDSSIGISVEEAKTLDWREYIQTQPIIEMKRAYDSVLERGHGWLYIYGDPGNGKTIMAKSATVYASTILNIPVRYRKVSEVMNHLRASYDEDDGQRTYLYRLNEWAKIKMLVLDEVGRDRMTDFGKQSLSDLMDSRYESSIAGKTVTIWISNYKPEDIFEPYQIDRIRDGRHKVIEVAGGSIRPALSEPRVIKDAWWIDY